MYGAPPSTSTSVTFRSLRGAASLKRVGHLGIPHVGIPLPLSSGSGLIEAGSPCPWRCPPPDLPLSSGSGLIEASTRRSSSAGASFPSALFGERPHRSQLLQVWPVSAACPFHSPRGAAALKQGRSVPRWWHSSRPFRSLRGAASLKPVERPEADANLQPFRSLRGAASLKRRPPHRRQAPSAAFRSLRGAASLKRSSARPGCRSHRSFRSLRGAASLKRRGASPPPDSARPSALFGERPH